MLTREDVKKSLEDVSKEPIPNIVVIQNDIIIQLLLDIRDCLNRMESSLL